MRQVPLHLDDTGGSVSFQPGERAQNGRNFFSTAQKNDQALLRWDNVKLRHAVDRKPVAAALPHDDEDVLCVPLQTQPVFLASPFQT